MGVLVSEVFALGLSFARRLWGGGVLALIQTSLTDYRLGFSWGSCAEMFSSLPPSLPPFKYLLAFVWAGNVLFSCF